MNRKQLSRLAALAILLCLFVGTLAAQGSEAAAPPNGEHARAASSEGSNNDANAGIGEILAATSEKAAHTAETWGRTLGIGPKSSFTISILFNFLALFGFFYVLLKSKLPQAFRERTAAIQKGIREAQESSADAARRLSDIEARLVKLDP
jgi:hypothetical protein